MSTSDKDTLVDLWLRKLKNHKLVAGLMVAATCIIGAASLTDAMKKLSAAAENKERPPTAGAGITTPPIIVNNGTINSGTIDNSSRTTNIIQPQQTVIHQVEPQMGGQSSLGSSATQQVNSQPSATNNEFSPPAHWPTQRWPGEPSKGVQLAVPYSPGGQADFLARLLVRNLVPRYHEVPFFVENRAGGAGQLARKVFQQSPRDGGALLIDRVGAVDQQLEPALLLASIPSVLLSRRDAPWRTTTEFIEAVKRAPDKFKFGTWGLDSESAAWLARLRTLTQLRLIEVRYPSARWALDDLRAGNLDVLVVDAKSAEESLQGRAVLPLAVTTNQRSRVLPQVPTLTEEKIYGLSYATHFALYLPEGTNQDIVRSIRNACRAALSTSDARGELALRGFEWGPEQSSTIGDPMCSIGSRYCGCRMRCLPSNEACPSKCS